MQEMIFAQDDDPSWKAVNEFIAKLLEIKEPIGDSLFKSRQQIGPERNARWTG